MVKSGGSTLGDAVDRVKPVLQRCADAGWTQVLLIHIDEIQLWDSLRTWERPPLADRAKKIVTPEHAKNYRLISLCQVVRELSKHKHIQFVLTGTAAAVSRPRFDSSLKAVSFTLPYFGATAVEGVLRKALTESYINTLTSGPTQDLHWLCQKLQGTPRVIQYFLQAIVSSAPTDAIDTVISKAASRFSEYLDGNASSFCVTRELLVEIFTVFNFPTTIPGAELVTTASVGCTVCRVPARYLPTSWRASAQQGIPRVMFDVQHNGVDCAYLFPIYPLLGDYLRRQLGAVGRDIGDHFTTMFPKDISDPNYLKGRAFERAIAIELSDATSPLWAEIAKRVRGVAPGQSHPAICAALGPSFTDAIRDQVAAGRKVYMVQEVRNGTWRWVDVAVGCRVAKKVSWAMLKRLFIKDPQPVVTAALCIEAKNSPDMAYIREGAASFFQAASTSSHASTDVFVFMSYHAIQFGTPRTKDGSDQVMVVKNALKRPLYGTVSGKEVFAKCRLPFKMFCEPDSGFSAGENAVLKALQSPCWEFLFSKGNDAAFFVFLQAA